MKHAATLKRRSSPRARLDLLEVRLNEPAFRHPDKGKSLACCRGTRVAHDAIHEPDAEKTGTQKIYAVCHDDSFDSDKIATADAQHECSVRVSMIGDADDAAVIPRDGPSSSLFHRA